MNSSSNKESFEIYNKFLITILGGWAPTDNSKGQMYFEIQFPEIALVNKIATQGGRSLGKGPHSYTCNMERYVLLNITHFSQGGVLF